MTIYFLTLSNPERIRAGNCLLFRPLLDSTAGDRASDRTSRATKRWPAQGRWRDDLGRSPLRITGGRRSSKSGVGASACLSGGATLVGARVMPAAAFAGMFPRVAARQVAATHTPETLKRVVTSRYAANPNSCLLTRFCARLSPGTTLSSWLLRRMCMASFPWMTLQAQFPQVIRTGMYGGVKVRNKAKLADELPTAIDQVVAAIGS